MHVIFQGHSRVFFPSEMDGLPSDEFDSVRVKEPTRHTFAYQVPTIDVSELKRLISYLKSDVLINFNKNYGNLLLILNTPVDPMALITLFQFYDKELRCFTFQDYQLVPTLEEYVENFLIIPPPSSYFLCLQAGCRNL